MSIEVAIQDIIPFYPHPETPIPWEHTPLHSLESIWWVAVWAAFTFRAVEVIPNAADQALFEALFNGNPKAVERYFLMQISSGRKAERLGSVSYNTDIFLILADWGGRITEAHREAQLLGGSPLDSRHAQLQAITARVARETEGDIETVMNLDGIHDKVVHGDPKAPFPTYILDPPSAQPTFGPQSRRPSWLTQEMIDRKNARRMQRREHDS